MRGRRRNSPRDRRMHGPSAAGASQYSLHSLGRPHLAELGHLRRHSGAVRRQRQHRPPCRRRVRAGQRVLHQLDLGAEPGRDPHRAVQPPERRLHARRRTASRTGQHRQAAAAGRLPDGADRQMASEKGTSGIRLLQRFPRSGHLPRPGIQDGRKLDGRRQGRRRRGGKGILDRSGDRQGDPLDQRAGPDEALFYVLPLQGYARTVRFPTFTTV